MARLAIEKTVLRNLALLSRNHCAFPGCTHPLMNGDTFVAELWHIESAEPGGPRYNPAQTDDQRRSQKNLLFLCHRHHKETDDVTGFSVEKLRQMKRAHEASPMSVHNPDRLVQAVEKLEMRQKALLNQVEKLVSAMGGVVKQGYKIHTPDGKGPWIPEQGQMYEYDLENGARMKVMMKEDVACIEHQLPDGAVAYYEVTENGSVRNNCLPYPLEQYELVIPPAMIVDERTVRRPDGVIETRYALKWAGSVVALRHPDGRLSLLEINARSVWKHGEKHIEVLNR